MQAKSSDLIGPIWRPMTLLQHLAFLFFDCTSNCSASSEPTQIKEHLLNTFPISFPVDQVVECTQKKKKKKELWKRELFQIMFTFLSIIFLLCSPSEIHACAHTRDPQSVCWREYFSHRSTKLESLGMEPYSTFSHKHLKGGSSTLKSANYRYKVNISLVQNYDHIFFLCANKLTPKAVPRFKEFSG